MAQFDLQGRTIYVQDGALRSDDGTLAGSDLTMDLALRNSMTMLGLSLAEASALASGNPAAFLGLGGVTGAIRPGLAADLVHLDDAFNVQSVWVKGQRFEYR